MRSKITESFSIVGWIDVYLSAKLQKYFKRSSKLCSEPGRSAVDIGSKFGQGSLDALLHVDPDGYADDQSYATAGQRRQMIQTDAVE